METSQLTFPLNESPKPAPQHIDFPLQHSVPYDLSKLTPPGGEIPAEEFSALNQMTYEQLLIVQAARAKLPPVRGPRVRRHGLMLHPNRRR